MSVESKVWVPQDWQVRYKYSDLSYWIEGFQLSFQGEPFQRDINARLNKSLDRFQSWLATENRKRKIERANPPAVQIAFFLSPNTEEFLVPKRSVNRDEFGPGKAGVSAFYAMLYGDGCERLMDLEHNELCGQNPIRVLDFDVMGDLEQKLVCSDDCQENIMSKVNEDLAAIGRNTIFGINGFGRA